MDLIAFNKALNKLTEEGRIFYSVLQAYRITAIKK